MTRGDSPRFLWGMHGHLPQNRRSEQLIGREIKGKVSVVSAFVIPALKQEDCHEFKASLALRHERDRQTDRQTRKR